MRARDGKVGLIERILLLGSFGLMSMIYGFHFFPCSLPAYCVIRSVGKS